MLSKIFSIETAYAQVGQVASDKSSETLGFIQSAVEFLWLQVPRWVAAVFLVLFTFLLAKLVKSMVENKMAENGIEEEHQEIAILAGRSAHAGVLIIGVTIALKVGGIDLTSIIAAVAFGIGFALRDLIMNFLAGGMILLSRQFTIGDFIKVNDTIGKVEEIQTRATILKALDGTKIIVPNADLFTNQVISFTSNPFRRIEVVVGVEYHTNLQVAFATIMRALKKNKGILLEPAPAVLYDEFSDSSININVRFWVESRSKWLETKSQAIQDIKRELDIVGIGIPFPIRTVFSATEPDAAAVQQAQAAASQQEEAKMSAVATAKPATPSPQAPQPTIPGAPALPAQPPQAAAPAQPQAAPVAPQPPLQAAPEGNIGQ